MNWRRWIWETVQSESSRPYLQVFINHCHFRNWWSVINLMVIYNKSAFIFQRLLCFLVCSIYNHDHLACLTLLLNSFRWFENLAHYCQEFSNLIPVAFVLGFYVSLVVGRFWEQFRSIPWPSRMALFVSALLQGYDKRGRLMRRTIMRYLCLAYILTTSAISPPVKKRFPKLDHITEAGRK